MAGFHLVASFRGPGIFFSSLHDPVKMAAVKGVDENEREHDCASDCISQLMPSKSEQNALTHFRTGTPQHYCDISHERPRSDIQIKYLS